MTPDALARLPRAWWFPQLKGFRSTESRRTYLRYPLDDQPEIRELDGDLSWLEPVPEYEESIAAPSFTTDELRAVAGAMRVPPALALLASRADLQRRIRSVTSCYLDLAEVAVAAGSDGGRLVHVLSDQQWTLHWLLYTDAVGNEAVVATAEPLGFGPEFWDSAPPAVVPLDGSFELDVCADSFEEFLFRYWIENELWLALRAGGPLRGSIAEYARRLPPIA